MIKKPRRLLCLMFSVVILILTLPNLGLSSYATDTEDYFTYYGFNKLTDSNLSDAYKAICTGVGSKTEIIDLSPYSLTQEQFYKAFEVYLNDHGRHYWLPTTYSMSLSGEKMKTLNLEYLTGFDDTAFNTAADELLKVTENKVTDYDKALALHDALVKHVTYDLNADNAHNAYGAIVGKKAVCEGYAEAYQYLLQQVGIQAYLVSGKGNGEPHEWNLVRLDDNYYYTDVTWDDPVTESEEEKPVYYPFFNITTERLLENHTISDDYDILPQCTDDSMMYTDYTKLETFTIDTVVPAFKRIGTKKIARIYNTGSEDFTDWFNANYKSIFTNIGAISASLSICNRETYIVCSLIPVATDNILLDRTEVEIEEGSTLELKATVIPSDSTDDVIWQSDKTDVASVDQSGNVTAHKPGVAVITATCGEKIAECKVTVTQSFALGDANKDRTIDIRDLVRIKTYILSGKYDELADLNSDNNIDTKDCCAMRAYLIGITTNL